MPELTRLLAIEGVRRVIVTTAEPRRDPGVALDPIAEVRHRGELQEAMAELRQVRGVTVLIHDDRCAAEERRLRRRGRLPQPTSRVWINPRVCEGCGDCGEKSSCLSVIPVETELGRKTAIDQGSCNHDLSCLDGDCPSFVIVTPKRSSGRRPDGGPSRPSRPSTWMPDPAAVPRMTSWSACRASGGQGWSLPRDPADGRPHRRSLRRRARPNRPGPKGRPGDLRHPLLHPTDRRRREGRSPFGGPVAWPRRARCGHRGEPGGRRSGTNSGGGQHRRGGHGGNGAGPLDSFPKDAGRIDRATRAPENLYLDAQWISERLFGDHLPTNLVMLGAAYQHGCLPVTAGAIEEAISLNGTGAPENLAAFRWGRAAVIDPAAVTAALTPAAPPAPAAPASLRRILGSTPAALVDVLERRAADLAGYQSDAYARRYVEEVLETARIESERTGDPAFPVTAAFARGLHKLMAYKDEYEVARLHLDSTQQAAVVAEFGEGATTKVMLHPPVLKSLGLARSSTWSSRRAGFPDSACRPTPTGNGPRSLRADQHAPDRTGPGRRVPHPGVQITRAADPGVG